MKTNDHPVDAALREALRRLDMEEDAPRSSMKESHDDARTLHAATPLHRGRAARRTRRLPRIAAIFLAAAFLGLLAWAVIPRLISSKKDVSQPAQTTAPSLQGRAGGGSSSSVGFSDIRLDSLLAVVAAHYDRQVCFRDTALRQLRLYTTWDEQQPLSAFIAALNEFDGLQLTDERDTIFVESTGKEAEE